MYHNKLSGVDAVRQPDRPTPKGVPVTALLRGGVTHGRNTSSESSDSVRSPHTRNLFQQIKLLKPWSYFFHLHSLHHSEEQQDRTSPSLWNGCSKETGKLRNKKWAQAEDDEATLEQHKRKSSLLFLRFRKLNYVSTAGSVWSNSCGLVRMRNDWQRFVQSICRSPDVTGVTVAGWDGHSWFNQTGLLWVTKTKKCT